MTTQPSKKSKLRIVPHNNAPHLPPGGVPIFLAVASILQILFFFLHFMIYETLVAAFGIGGDWLRFALAVLSLTFISGSILVTKSKHSLVQAYYRLAGIWCSFIAPLCGACFGFVVIECLLPYLGIVVAPVIAGALCFGVAIAITLYGIWNGMRQEITKVAVHLEQLPVAWRGKKAVFFSDSHFGALWGRGFAKRMVKKMKALNPEVIFMGGDMFDGVQCDTDMLLAPFKELQPRLGMYYVTGNHEYIWGDMQFVDAVRRSNFKILNNEVVDLEGIQLIGVDYKDSHKKEEFAALLAALPIQKEKPSILLKHVPEFLDTAEQAGISLTLSGHTHRGQFWPLSLITRRIYKGFDYGLKRLRGMQVYTSSGVGGWMSPFRFGTKSEIVQIEFI